MIDFEAARKVRLQRREELCQKRRVKNNYPASANPKKARIEEGRKNRRRTIYAAAVSAIIAVIGASVFNIFSVQADYDEQLRKQEALLAQKQRLAEELSNADDPEYVEHQARKLLRMIRPGERLYILPDEPKAENRPADE